MDILKITKYQPTTYYQTQTRCPRYCATCRKQPHSSLHSMQRPRPASHAHLSP